MGLGIYKVFVLPLQKNFLPAVSRAGGLFAHMFRSSDPSDSRMRLWDRAHELRLSLAVCVQQDLNKYVLILASTNNSRTFQPSLTAKAGNTNTTAAMIRMFCENSTSKHPTGVESIISPSHIQSSLDSKKVPGSPKTGFCLRRSHTSVMPSASVLFIIPRLDAKELFECSKYDGKVGLIWGGNSAFMLFIMIFSKGAPSAHRKINISYIIIQPLATNLQRCLK